MDRARAHPTARALLTDELFWDEGDAYGPHGNDTGHDVLAAYLRASGKRTPDPAKWFAGELRRWGLVAADWYMLEGERAVRAAKNDPSRLLLDDALIGLAFAVLKVRGELPRPLLEITMIALDRQALDGIVRLRGWASPTRRVSALATMRAALQAG